MSLFAARAQHKHFSLQPFVSQRTKKIDGDDAERLLLWGRRRIGEEGVSRRSFGLLSSAI